MARESANMWNVDDFFLIKMSSNCTLRAFYMIPYSCKYTRIHTPVTHTRTHTGHSLSCVYMERKRVEESVWYGGNNK